MTNDVANLSGQSSSEVLLMDQYKAIELLGQILLSPLTNEKLSIMTFGPVLMLLHESILHPYTHINSSSKMDNSSTSG